MMNSLWVKFPAKPTGDSFLDALPPGVPQAKPGQVSVEIRAILILNESEGPIASQTGCLLDVIAGIAKTGGAVAGMLFGSWEE